MLRISLCVIMFLSLPMVVAAQTWDFGKAEKLSNNINTEYEEIFPLLSPDGKTLFFTRVLYPQNYGGKFSGSDAWISTHDPSNQNWGKAFNPKSTLNDRGNTSVIGVGSDNKSIYLLNTSPNQKANGIYISKKLGSSWSKPELIPIGGIEMQGFLGGYVSPDFDVIFLSMKAPDSRGEEDLYVSVKGTAGSWSKPKNLGSSINTPGFEISPFLSPDKTRLYFASNGHSGFGDADIYYCDRLYDSWETWTAPRNLGEKLNSKNFDAYFSIYGDTIAYFVSNRNAKYSDIYKIKVVPGDEALGFGKRYLTNDEVAESLGANVSRRVIFENNATELTSPQKELLYFMANKLSKNKAINLQLSVLEENDKSLTEARMSAIANYLRSEGIENIRLLLTNSDKIKRPNKTRTVIDILLFR